MPLRSKVFSYQLPDLSPSQYPNIPKPRDAKIAVSVGPECDIDIVGNSEGLLYLAQYLAALGLHTNDTGLHIHLDPESDLDKDSLKVTIHNLDFTKDSKDRVKLRESIVRKSK